MNIKLKTSKHTSQGTSSIDMVIYSVTILKINVYYKTSLMNSISNGLPNGNVVSSGNVIVNNTQQAQQILSGN